MMMMIVMMMMMMVMINYDRWWMGGTHWPQVGEAEGGGGRSGRDLGVIVITIVIISGCGSG